VTEPAAPPAAVNPRRVATRGCRPADGRMVAPNVTPRCDNGIHGPSHSDLVAISQRPGGRRSWRGSVVTRTKPSPSVPSGNGLPWWDHDPLEVTLQAMGMAPRTPKNAPYRLLKAVVLYILPTVTIFFAAEQLFHRDVALALDGAFWGVQLGRLWHRLRQAVDVALDFGREYELTPWQSARSWVSEVLLQPRRISFKFNRSADGTGLPPVEVTSAVRGYQLLLDQVRLRRVERIWPRYMTVLEGRPVRDGRTPYPAIDPNAWYPRNWWARRWWARTWSFHRALRSLMFLAKMLDRYGDFSLNRAERVRPVTAVLDRWSRMAERTEARSTLAASRA
jgi:hypothetical protein